MALVKCSECGALHDVADEQLGQEGICYSCSHTFVMLSTEDASSGSSELGEQSVHQVEFSIKDIEKMWGDTIAPDASPSMSIRHSAREAHGAVIKLRERQLCASHIPGSGDPEQSDFELVEAIAQGGMGVVFRANQVAVGREVALKMLKPDSAANESDQQSFLEEAVITASLDHPNIVPIHDLGKGNDGTLFYAMKDVKGIPWEDCMDSKTEAENLDIFLSVCDAIAYAHDQGIIHRDIKPQNVMIGSYGEVYVMDWGIAAKVNTSEYGAGMAIDLSHESSRAGTPAYMAPEMAQCRHNQIGTCSDIYLLGGILYEIITSLAPHYHESIYSSIYMAAENIIVPTEGENELLRIALKAMDTDITKRYESVQELQSAVRECIVHLESLSLHEAAVEHLQEAIRKKDYLLFNKALVGFEEAVRQWPGNDEAADDLRDARLTYAEYAIGNGDLELAESVLDLQESSHVDLAKKVAEQRKARDARRRHSRYMRLGLQTVGVALLLVVSVAAFWISEERRHAVDGEQRARSLLREVEKQKKVAEEGERRAKTLLAQVESERARSQEALDRVEQERRRAQGAEQVAKNEQERALIARKRAEDERKKALVALNEARRANNDAARARNYAIKTKQSLVEKNLSAYSASMKLTAEMVADERYEVAVNNLAKTETSLRHWEWGFLQNQCRAKSALVLPLPAMAMAVSMIPDRDVAVVQCSGGKYISYDLKSGEVVRELQLPVKESVFSPAEKQIFYPAGKYLGTLSWDGLNITTPGRNIKGHDFPVTFLHASPDGRRIMSADKKGKIICWRSVALKPECQLDGPECGLTQAVFSADRNGLAYLDKQGRVDVWNILKVKHVGAFTDLKDVKRIALSDDGSQLIVCSGKNRLQLYSAADQRKLADLVLPNMAVDGALFVAGHNEQVLVYGSDGVLLLNPIDGKKSQPFPSARQNCNLAAYYPDKGRLLACGRDQKLRCFGWFEKQRDPLHLSVLKGALAVAPLPGRPELIVAGCRDDRVVIWDVFRDLEKKSIPGFHAGSAGRSVVASSDWFAHRVKGGVAVWGNGPLRKLTQLDNRDGDRAVDLVASPKGGVLFVNWSGRTMTAYRISAKGGIRDKAYLIPQGFRSLACDRDGSAAFTVGRFISRVTIPQGNIKRTGLPGEGVKFLLPMGQHLLQVFKSGAFSVVDLGTGKAVLSVNEGQKPVASAAVSSDRKRLFLGTMDGDLQVYHLGRGALVFSQKAHQRPVSVLAISSDNKIVFTGDGNELKVWVAGAW